MEGIRCPLCAALPTGTRLFTVVVLRSGMHPQPTYFTCLSILKEEGPHSAPPLQIVSPRAGIARILNTSRLACAGEPLSIRGRLQGACARHLHGRHGVHVVSHLIVGDPIYSRSYPLNRILIPSQTSSRAARSNYLLQLPIPRPQSLLSLRPRQLTSILLVHITGAHLPTSNKTKPLIPLCHILRRIQVLVNALIVTYLSALESVHGRRLTGGKPPAGRRIRDVRPVRNAFARQRSRVCAL